MKKLSVVVPAYNEEDCVAKFAEALFGLGIENPMELVFVDDGSSDGTLAAIKAAAAADDRVRYVSFSRNFGKEAELLAGLSHATGDYVVTMDADLQHDPKLLPGMLRALEDEGYDCAAARRTTWEGESFLRRWFARRFYAVMRSYSDVDLKDGSMDYRMMTRQVVDAVLSMKESDRFTKGMYQWVGFRTKWFECANTVRVSGASKWSFKSLFAYSLRGIIAFSTMPLHLSFVLGAVLSLSGLAWLACLAAMRVPCGWPLLACIVLVVGGVQLVAIGVLGLYIASVFRESKHRPGYIVKESR
jgi:glycosyltransferase involved in cell wall biosynthesis